MFNIESLRSMSDAELTKISKDLGVKVARNSTENDKIFAILDFQASNPIVTGDYYNATQTTMKNQEEENAKPIASTEKKTRGRKKAEKPAELFEEIPVEEIATEEKTSEEVKTQEEETEVAAASAKRLRKRISSEKKTEENPAEPEKTPTEP